MSNTQSSPEPEQFEAADITPESWPVSKMAGNYTAMVHRNPDGSDPLVQEPKK